MDTRPAQVTTTTRLDLAAPIAGAIADKSPGTARKYAERLAHFAGWLAASGYPPIDKITLADYRRSLVAAGLSASTINGHLVAVRAVIREAADLGLLDDRSAERAAGVRGVKERGERAGNWLGLDEAQALLDAPDKKTLRGKRDRAILALLLFCGLRRQELASLTIGDLQMREGHHVIADMLGKGGRVRTIKLPVAVWRAIDSWLSTSGRERQPGALVFVAMRKGDRLAEGASISAQAIYKLVAEYGAAIGRPELRPHDARRTFAKLARHGGAALEDISLTLGHASLQTTQRYLGLTLDLDNSAPDAVGLKMGAR